MLYRSACTKELVDVLETQVLQGVSFLKICEVLAALNFKEFSERMERHALFTTSVDENTEDLYERFYTDTMSSFPSKTI